MTTHERRNVTAPPDWWAAFEKAAEKDGKTVSEWLRDAGLAQLPKTVRAQLSEPRAAHRPKLPRE